MHRGLGRGHREMFTRYRSRPQQPGQPGEVAGGHREHKAGADPFDAAVDGLGKAADRLAPAERLLDALAVLLGQGVAFVPGGAAVDRRVPGFPRDMRRDAGLSQVAHEVRAVVAAVCAQRQLAGGARGMGVDHGQRGPALGMATGPCEIGLHDQATAVLHQRMTDEAQHRARAGRLLVEPRVGIGCRGMCRVRPLLTPEVDLGIAGLAVGAGHRGGLGWELFRLVFGGAGGAGRAARIVVRRRVARLGLKALHGRPGLHKGAVDREVVVRQQRCDLSMGQDRRHHLARHLGRQQAVPVLAEDRGDPHRIVDAEADKPPEQEVVLHLLHQLALGPDREQDLDQARPDQPLRRDRGPAEVGVERRELPIEAGERIVDHLPDRAQRVPRRDARLQINIAEQRPARLIRPAHHRPRKSLPRVNHVLHIGPRPDFFSSLLMHTPNSPAYRMPTLHRMLAEGEA